MWRPSYSAPPVSYSGSSVTALMGEGAVPLWIRVEGENPTLLFTLQEMGFTIIRNSSHLKHCLLTYPKYAQQKGQPTGMQEYARVCKSMQEYV